MEYKKEHSLILGTVYSLLLDNNNDKIIMLLLFFYYYFKQMVNGFTGRMFFITFVKMQY